MQEDDTKHSFSCCLLSMTLWRIMHYIPKYVVVVFVLKISPSCSKCWFGILAFTFRFTEFHLYKVKEEAAFDG